MTNCDEVTRRRKRLRFRCWHRGSLEADLLFGRFADRHLDGLDCAQLSRLEALLAQEEPVIWGWVTGREPVPRDFDHDVMAMLRRPPARRTPDR